MLFVCHCNFVAAAVLLLFCSILQEINASTITAAPQASSTTKDSTGICEFRTINYITDSLPQLCLRSSWSANGTSISTTAPSGDAAATSVEQAESASTTSSEVTQEISQRNGGDIRNERSLSDEPMSTAASLPPTSPENVETSAEIENGELNEASFLSFEEWKKQTLEKAGQPNSNIGNKRSPGGNEHKKGDSESIQNNLDSLGDDGEIDLDFGAFRNGVRSEETVQSSEANSNEARLDLQARDVSERRKDQHRKQDAGKTCKERFSYASFDAGATILKTHPGAKNAKAVLIENKDSYMLSECAAENKFLIVELSEDIWIDTLVLANYEFFSSMIRTFRVSVSDRYPVKMEKWKDLGIYEARNSREIQAFLIENPQIWARYLRIEFLSHYGNEYYCPLSLVRVHGTRMLESWKETEASSDDDLEEIDTPGDDEQFIPDAIADEVREEERLNAELKEAQAAIEELVKTAESITPDNVEPALTSSHLLDVNRSLEIASTQQLTTTWNKTLYNTPYFLNIGQVEEFCLQADAPSRMSVDPEARNTEEVTLTESGRPTPTDFLPTTTGGPVSPEASSPYRSNQSETISMGIDSVPNASLTAMDSSNIAKSVSGALESSTPSIASTASRAQNNTNPQKNKTTSTSSASSSLPTIQESFFKAVSRRLQLLETNSTLSLKYIEEQSKILREAFSKVEKKQLQKSTSFLDTLNSTVLAELRGFRQQYDEIWQSTVISLESQKEESRREILAISARLNILADEVVFQKRMSIVQSILLLLCLGLVIFSRVSVSGHLDFAGTNSRQRNFSGFPVESPIESPPDSPEFHRTGPSRGARPWLDTEHRRPRSDESAVSRSRSRDDSPPTPISSYSRSENGFTPQYGVDEIGAESNSDYIRGTLEHSKVPSETNAVKYNSSGVHGSVAAPAELVQASSPMRTPKKRKAFIRQQSGPPVTSPDDNNLIDESDRANPDLSPDSTGIAKEDIGIADGSPPLPSPPPEKERPSFSIARKPLPALPADTN